MFNLNWLRRKANAALGVNFEWMLADDAALNQIQVALTLNHQFVLVRGKAYVLKHALSQLAHYLSADHSIETITDVYYEKDLWKRVCQSLGHETSGSLTNDELKNMALYTLIKRYQHNQKTVITLRLPNHYAHELLAPIQSLLALNRQDKVVVSLVCYSVLPVKKLFRQQAQMAHWSTAEVTWPMKSAVAYWFRQVRQYRQINTLFPAMLRDTKSLFTHQAVMAQDLLVGSYRQLFRRHNFVATPMLNNKMLKLLAMPASWRYGLGFGLLLLYWWLQSSTV